MDTDTPPLRLEWRDASELADNPANWRRHPQSQLAALDAVIQETGWAGAALYNEQTGRLIDGHARKKVRPDGKIPVLIGSWSESQEALILATLDPIGAMATTDEQALAAVVASVETENEQVRALLDAMVRNEPQPDAPEVFPVVDETLETEHECPKCGYTWSGSA